MNTQIIKTQLNKIFSIILVDYVEPVFISN